MMYRVAARNGIDCCNNQTLLICIETTHFDWMGLNCCIQQIVMWGELVFNSLVNGCENMSHMTCHDVS